MKGLLKAMNDYLEIMNETDDTGIWNQYLDRLIEEKRKIEEKNLITLEINEDLSPRDMYRDLTTQVYRRLHDDVHDMIGWTIALSELSKEISIEIANNL